ncbi:MAG: T9SS type A sorting domain-containing protein [Chitinophagaceae bacterium]|nr:T9SS type A sorting domain-containing protein [Chitinophagaceae bacterium]
MKRNLLCAILLLSVVVTTRSQVTRLSNNTSYDWGFALTSTRIILRSQITKTLWVYDVPGNSFTELSSAATVEADYDHGIMGGKLYFAGRTVAEGIELWVTDGTVVGTSLLKDINTSGAADSEPKYGFIEYDNELYFTANDGSSGRELWKTNGTGPGTVRVKDINTGAPDAFVATPASHFSVINNILVFSATTAADGGELWKTDGTEPGTIQLKNIYTTATYGSYISNFTVYLTDLLFTAFDEVNGNALWKTDGTVGGTVMIKDIDPSPPIPPPFYYFLSSIIPAFFNFQNELFFTGNDGTNGYELWKTNGTTAGTVLIKDINPGFDDGMPQMFSAVKNSSKFFFSATTADEGTELWESDGSGPGTLLLKDIATGIGVSSDVIVLPNYFYNGLFQGNKFFLIATTPAEGSEFYVSDGTSGGTNLLKDINPGAPDGYDGANLFYLYTNNKFYFTADNNTNGSELWQSDASGPGTSLVADVNALPPSAGSDIQFATVTSGNLYFFATDGDDAVNTDFFRLDASLALPLRWVSIEAKPYNNDVVLTWKTADEEQTGYFVIERSANGISYTEAGRINANGNNTNSYSYTDVGAMQRTGIKRWYYRVRCVDIDGKASLSRIVTVTLNGNIPVVRIVPNPATHELKLLIDAAGNGRATICILDMNGKMVLQKWVDVHRGENIIRTDAGHLPSGAYLVQVINDGSVATERLLIQR